jgi:hypothetical protein
VETHRATSPFDRPCDREFEELPSYALPPDLRDDKELIASFANGPNLL